MKTTTIKDETTGKVLYATVGEYQLLEGQKAIPRACESPFIVPYHDEETDTFYEGATQEEIAEHQKKYVPQSVSERQLKQALIMSDVTLESIDSVIAQIPDAKEKALVKSFWNDSNEFERNHPKLIEFAQILNISKEQADGIFVLASTL